MAHLMLHKSYRIARNGLGIGGTAYALKAALGAKDEYELFNVCGCAQCSGEGTFKRYSTSYKGKIA